MHFFYIFYNSAKVSENQLSTIITSIVDAPKNETKLMEFWAHIAETLNNEGPSIKSPNMWRKVRIIS